MAVCTDSFRLITMGILVLVYFLVELIVGYMVNSIALIADSFHMFSDLLSIVIGIAAIRISKWPRSSKNTFGWQRAEVMGSMVNSVVLVTLCLTITFEVIQRLFKKEPVEDPRLMFYVGIVGLLVNLIGLVVLGSHSHGHGHSHGPSETIEVDMPTNEDLQAGENLLSVQTKTDDPKYFAAAMNRKMSIKSDTNSDQHENCHLVQCKSISAKKSRLSMNMHAVFLHVLADFLGSVIVVASALILWLVPGDPNSGEAQWKLFIDPLMSLLMVAIILYSVIPLLYKTSLILLQSVPADVCVRNLKSRISKIEGVIHVHDLHVWHLQSNVNIGTVHIRCRNIEDYNDIAREVQRLFHEANVHCTTIQPEFDQINSMTDKNGCSFDCARNRKCPEDSCCPAPGPKADSTAEQCHGPLAFEVAAVPANTNMNQESQNSSTAEWAYMQNSAMTLSTEIPTNTTKV